MRTTIRSAAVLFLALVALIGVVALAAQPEAAEPVSARTPGAVTAPAATGSAAVAPAAAAVPVPIPSEQAMRYYRSGNLLWILGTLWGFAVPALLLFTGFSARLRTLAQRIGRNWFFTVAAFGVLFSVVGFLLDLPLAYYSGFVRQHAYDLSAQTAAKWWTDAAKGLAIGCVFNGLFLWVPYLLLRTSPRRWWLYTALLAVPLMAVMLIVAPIWIEPLFNKFGPMQDKALEAKILALAERAGIEGSRVFEVDKSVDTKTVNAYVTGIFGTKRIVLWDTTLAKLDERQVLLVMGHEMGHYVLGHVPKLLALATLLIVLGLWVIHRTAGSLIARFRERFGFDELADVASVPLMGLLFGVVIFLVTPGILAFTRHTEHESDRFALEITRDNQACGTAFVRLQEENLSNPRPGMLYKTWRSSHPPLGERIDFCNEYRPWETGEAIQYGDKIRPVP
jgi:STE24 endopeptidase